VDEAPKDFFVILAKSGAILYVFMGVLDNMPEKDKAGHRVPGF
jgi:hypothetical protein